MPSTTDVDEKNCPKVPLTPPTHAFGIPPVVPPMLIVMYFSQPELKLFAAMIVKIV